MTNDSVERAVHCHDLARYSVLQHGLDFPVGLQVIAQKINMSSGPPRKRLKQLVLNFDTIRRRSQQKEEEPAQITVTAEVHSQTDVRRTTTSLSPVVH